MDETFAAYGRTRARMTELFSAATPTELARCVPACPDWSVHDLAAHVVGIPAALGAGRMPDGDLDGWLQELVAKRRDREVDAMMSEWSTLDTVIAPMLQGPGGVLFGDLAVHEHDLRGALARPDHTALEVEVMMPRTLAGFATPLQTAGLGAIEVAHAGRSWKSHDAEPGWTLLVDPWEAVRAVNSRRTAAEVLALPCTGDPRPYVEVLDAHLPLPLESLGEL